MSRMPRASVELCTLCALARTLSIDPKQVDQLEQRSERIRKGSVTDNRVQRLRDIRNELAALVQQQAR